MTTDKEGSLLEQYHSPHRYQQGKQHAQSPALAGCRKCKAAADKTDKAGNNSAGQHNIEGEQQSGNPMLAEAGQKVITSIDETLATTVKLGKVQ